MSPAFVPTVRVEPLRPNAGRAPKPGSSRVWLGAQLLAATCQGCGALTPAEDLRADRSKPGGRAARCRGCDAARSGSYRAANLAAVRERDRARAPAYRAENLEASRERCRAYYAANRETMSGRKRTYYAANAARTDAEVVAARARLRPDGLKVCGGACGEALPFWEFWADRFRADGLFDVCRSCNAGRLWEIVAPTLDDRDAFRCVYCDGPAEEVEHVVPRRDRGADVARNLAPSCAVCNRGIGGKHTRPVLDFVETRFGAALVDALLGRSAAPLAA